MSIEDEKTNPGGFRALLAKPSVYTGATPGVRSAPIVRGMTPYNFTTELQIRLAARRPFDEIEEWIEELAAAEDIKAALWLVAWSEQDRPVQRRVALDALT